jgi:energy-converting hydrogenase Eha subunit E
MFLMFSNRLGCLGSLAVTAVGTLILLFAMGWL